MSTRGDLIFSASETQLGVDEECVAGGVSGGNQKIEIEKYQQAALD
jgi:hypothetical protein